MQISQYVFNSLNIIHTYIIPQISIFFKIKLYIYRLKSDFFEWQISIMSKKDNEKNAYSQYGLYYTKAVFLLLWKFHNIGEIAAIFFIVKMIQRQIIDCQNEFRYCQN